MNKDEFLAKLEELLACLPKAQVEEACRFYGEAIADRIEDGMGEEEAVAAIGTPGAAAEAILNELPVVPRAIAKTRRISDALLWALVILGSPVWLALLAAFTVVAFGVYTCIWAMALCVWAFVLALAVSGAATAALALAGVSAGLAPYAIAMTGCAVGFIGAALLVGMFAWAVSRRIARLSALWAKKALSPFIKRKGGDTCDQACVVARHGKAHRIYLAVAVALIVLGVVLAAVGFVASGFNASIFSTRIDFQAGTVILGGTNVADPAAIFPLQQLAALGQIDTSSLCG